MRENKYKLLFMVELPNPKEMSSDYYTITTTGKKSGIYRVRKKADDIIHTWCVGEIGSTTLRIGGHVVRLPIYGHYVLTEAGLREVKKLAIKEGL